MVALELFQARSQERQRLRFTAPATKDYHLHLVGGIIRPCVCPQHEPHYSPIPVDLSLDQRNFRLTHAHRSNTDQCIGMDKLLMP
jgi:hypothetical protein